MAQKAISAGPVHSLPADLREVLISDPAAWAKWKDITPLARNEWICWVISVKKPETRRQHIERVRRQLKEGMRRPCCWPGCPHRRVPQVPTLHLGLLFFPRSEPRVAAPVAQLPYA
jgi:hypothetical protein